MVKSIDRGSGDKGSDKELVPTVHDFAKPAIKRALKRHAFNHGTTRYSVVFFLLSILAGGFFGFSQFVFTMAVATFGFGCLAWVYLYFVQAGNFELRYVERLQRAIQSETERKRERVKQDLTEHGCPEGAKQVDKLQAKFESLTELLADKLDTSELTYNRYFGIAQEVFLSGLDNLTSIVAKLKSISEIDERHINKRLKLLEESDKQDLEVEKEKDTLRSRLAMRKNQLEFIKKLMLENEEAMTQLDSTTIAIANIDTIRGEAEIDMENSMAFLVEITERVGKYSL